MPNAIRKMSKEDFSSDHDQILKLYINAFSGPPYFEAFQPSEIKAMAMELWFKRNDGLVLCCYDKSANLLKGFFAGYNLALEKGICRIVNGQIECSYKEIFYMAEIAVHPSFRKQGVAFLLVQEALNIRSDIYENFLVRTNTGNQASIRLFQKAGFRHFNGAREIVQQTRTDGKLGEDERLFLTLNI